MTLPPTAIQNALRLERDSFGMLVQSIISRQLSTLHLGRKLVLLANTGSGQEAGGSRVSDVEIKEKCNGWKRTTPNGPQTGDQIHPPAEEDGKEQDCIEDQQEEKVISLHECEGHVTGGNLSYRFPADMRTLNGLQ